MWDGGENRDHDPESVLDVRPFGRKTPNTQYPPSREATARQARYACHCTPKVHRNVPPLFPPLSPVQTLCSLSPQRACGPCSSV